MTAPLYTFTVRDPNTIRDDMLRTLAAGLRARGIANPNVSPGSDYYVLAQALANECAVAEANAVLQADNLLPDTADITGLQRHGAILGLALRPAGPSTGGAIFNASAAASIAAGATLTDASGQTFTVTTTGIYSPGGLVPVQASVGGASTNHNAGDTLTWSSAAPPYSASTMLVGLQGLTGGVNAEDTETYRNRILMTYANPPGNGNATFIANACAASSTAVQAGFVYPAFEGPASVDAAVVGYQNLAAGGTRQVASGTVSTVVQPYVAGLLPEHVYLKLTNTLDRALDVSISLTLPAAPTASPPGPGGGWLDGSPWPTVNGFVLAGGNINASVSSVVSPVQFNVASGTAPVAGSTQISWVSPLTYTLYSAVVVTSALAFGGTYTITISTPFPGIFTGCAVFPTATNTAGYLSTLLQQFALMGPGEKTSTTGVLATAYRRPVPQQQWPYAMNATQLRALTNAFPEILNLQYVGLVAGGFIVNAPGSPPAHDPPYVWTPGNITFYAA